jgi:hypothetical protein
VQLRTPLGSWLSNCHDQRNWKYIQHGDDIIDKQSNPFKYYTITRRRVYFTYTLGNHHHTTIPQVPHPVIPINKYYDKIVCNPPNDLPIIQHLNPSEYCDDIPIQSTGRLINDVTPQTKIIIASDGSLNNNQCTFGGLIATEDTIMVEINGMTPIQHDPTSLTAEAYGCFFTLQYLRDNLEQIFYINNIIIILDNTTLISRINKAKRYPPSPTQCLTDEHDIIYSIVDTLKSFPNAQIKHIKAHQSDDASNEAYLHNQCHRLAHDAHNMPIPIKPIVRLPIQQATLIINNHKIPSNFISTIRQITSTPALHQYYYEKFQWTPETISNIDWKSHGRALSSLGSKQKKMILQFNYRWLPFNNSHSVQAVGQGICCPYCMNEIETHSHFLSCYHPTSIAQWSTAAQDLQTQLKKSTNFLIKTY